MVPGRNSRNNQAVGVEISVRNGLGNQVGTACVRVFKDAVTQMRVHLLDTRDPERLPNALRSTAHGPDFPVGRKMIVPVRVREVHRLHMNVRRVHNFAFHRRFGNRWRGRACIRTARQTDNVDVIDPRCHFCSSPLVQRQPAVAHCHLKSLGAEIARSQGRGIPVVRSFHIQRVGTGNRWVTDGCRHFVQPVG